MVKQMAAGPEASRQDARRRALLGDAGRVLVALARVDEQHASEFAALRAAYEALGQARPASPVAPLAPPKPPVALAFLATLGAAAPGGVVSQGAEVSRWQAFLRAEGYDAPATGLFDLATRRATYRFQRDHGISATGIVGHDTRRKASELLARRTS